MRDTEKNKVALTYLFRVCDSSPSQTQEKEQLGKETPVIFK